MEDYELCLRTAERELGLYLAGLPTKRQRQVRWSTATGGPGRNQHNYNYCGETSWDRNTPKLYVNSEATCYMAIVNDVVCCDCQTGRAFRLGGVMETVRGRTWTKRPHIWWDTNCNLLMHWNTDDEDKWRVPAWMEQLLAALCSSSRGRWRTSEELELLLGVQAADQVSCYWGSQA